MPVLNEVDQQTQIMQALMQENQMLKESNANMQGVIDNFASKMIEGRNTPKTQPDAAVLSGREKSNSPRALG